MPSKPSFAFRPCAPAGARASAAPQGGRPKGRTAGNQGGQPCSNSNRRPSKQRQPSSTVAVTRSSTPSGSPRTEVTSTWWRATRTRSCSATCRPAGASRREYPRRAWEPASAWRPTRPSGSASMGRPGQRGRHHPLRQHRDACHRRGPSAPEAPHQLPWIRNDRRRGRIAIRRQRRDRLGHRARGGFPEQPSEERST